MNKLYQFVLLNQLNYLTFMLLLFANVLFANNNNIGTLKLGVLGSFNNLNPYSIIGVNPKDYYILMYDSLMVEQLDNLGNFKPLLAEMYEVNGNDIIFYLNKKAKWSDGTSITSDDIVFTFNVIKEFGNPYYKNKLLEVNKIIKVNEFSVIFQTNVFSKNLFNLIVSLPILSQSYWKGKDFLSPTLQIPTTSGAYLIEDYDLGKKIVFKKNSNYWGNSIPSRIGYFNFDKIIYTYVKIPQQLGTLYKKGDINFKKMEITDKVGVLDKIYVQNSNNIPTFKAYFFNTNTIDIELRKVISKAYDFNIVKKYFLSNNQARLQSLFENTSFKDSNFFFYNTKNLNEIKAVYDEEIKFLFKSNEDFKISQNFINNLKSLGFRVTYKISQYYNYLELRKKGDYDIIMEELLFSNFPQDELISYFVENSAYNYSKLSNSTINELVEKIKGNDTKKNKIKNLQKLDLKLKEMYIYIPLYYDVKTNYIYKDELVFDKGDVLDIFKWCFK